MKAIICDIDGTLADKGGRFVFDYDKVDQDTVKHVVAETIRIFHSHVLENMRMISDLLILCVHWLLSRLGVRVQYRILDSRRKFGLVVNFSLLPRLDYCYPKPTHQSNTA